MMKPDRRVNSTQRRASRLGAGLTDLLNAEFPLSAVICLLTATACWGFAAVDRPLLRPFADNQEQPQPSDAVVVLAGDEERWRYAETLVRSGVAPRTLSTLVQPRCGTENPAVQACSTGVRNTVDEALVMRRILLSEHIRHATVVTSDYHVLRAGAVFALVFAGSGIQIEMVPVAGRGQTPLPRLFRELGMLGPSLGGALLGRFVPTVYEALMRYRYHHRNEPGLDSSCLLTDKPFTS